MATKVYILIGWLAGISLAVCGLPQLLHTVSTGSTGDLAWGFLLLWFFGEIGMIAYLLGSRKGTAVLYFNYVLNAIITGTLVAYKLFSI